MALRTVQVSVEPRLSTALKDRSVVPYSSPKVSARLRYHVSNSVVFLHRAGTLAKGYRLSKLFSKAELVPFEKEININLVYFSCVKHANEMLLGDLRQVNQRTQSFHFPIAIHQSLDPAARSSAQAPCLYMHFEHSTGSDSVWVRTCRRVWAEVIICMITRDFSVISMTSQVSLSLYYSQKSLTHNIGSAFALPIISACEPVSSQKYENGYRTKICDFTLTCTGKADNGKTHIHLNLVADILTILVRNLGKIGSTTWRKDLMKKGAVTGVLPPFWTSSPSCCADAWFFSSRRRKFSSWKGKKRVRMSDWMFSSQTRVTDS